MPSRSLPLVPLVLLVCLGLGIPASAQEANPADGAAGEALIGELGCAGCHAGLPDSDLIQGRAPALGTDEVPLAPAHIFRYLADPQPVRVDIGRSRMPVFDLNEEERLALALFLTTPALADAVDDEFVAARDRHPDVTPADGERLFLGLNCAGCHAHPSVEGSRVGPSLERQGERTRPGWVRGYLADPEPIRPFGALVGTASQMPSFRLEEAELDQIAAYLEGRTGPEPLPDFEPDTLSRFSMDKAETLVRERLSCLGCHQLGDEGGRIGPRLDGVAGRLRPEWVREMIRRPEHLAPGTIMPTTLDIGRIQTLVASYLLGRDEAWTPSEAVDRTPTVTPAQHASASGADLYATRCAHCHGAEGRGDGYNTAWLPVVPTVHADPEAMSLRPDDTLYDGIHAGGLILGKSHRMPAFGGSLEPGEIRSLVAYIRALCDCQGPAWSRDGVGR